MKIIKPEATIMEHNITPYEFIEKVGRTCYKSEGLITQGSALKFVKNLVSRNHWAMLEHETIYVVMTKRFMSEFLSDIIYRSENLAFFNYSTNSGVQILSGSFRAFHDLFEKGYTEYSFRYLKYVVGSAFPEVFGAVECVESSQSHPECLIYSRQSFIDTFKLRPDILFKHLTHTVKFVCDRGVSHEFVRHRVASFAQESTRYCNYSQNKFGNEITVIEPFFYTDESRAEEYKIWKQCCEILEKGYLKLSKLGSTPQESRSILENSLKTELIITATETEWQHIVNLRYLGTTGEPHPQMKEAMALCVNDLVKESGGRIKL